MDFLPMPHVIEEKEGTFQIKWNTPIILARDTEPGALLWARMLREEIEKVAGLSLKILKGEGQPGAILLRVDDALAVDHLSWEVMPEGITVTGGSDEALLHGVCSLRQWIRRHGANVPALRVEDWPDLAHRGYYFDVSRGRMPKLDYLKSVIDLLCEYRINEFQLYIEHTYLFRDMSEVWRNEDALEAEDILELDAYCRARHIEMIPSLATFGHMYQILSTKSYAELCELRDSDKKPFSYTYAIRRHTINPTHPGALALVKGMIEEYSALFTSRKFNICCDETFDLCSDRSREAAEKYGAHNLYMDYLLDLCQWLVEKGITPLFWGDVLGEHPEAFSRLPEQVICLNWGYQPDYPEDEIRNLSKLGAKQYACPGVSNWSYLMPLMADSFENIRRMCSYAHRYGAIGLLNTSWGDWGHICDHAFTIPGMLYGAAFSWNAKEYSREEMNDAISFLYYGDETGDFMRALNDLTEQQAFPWFRFVRWIEAEGKPRAKELADALPGIRLVPEKNEKLQDALQRMNQATRHVHEGKRSVIYIMQTAAEGVRVMNEIGQYLAYRDAGENIPHGDPLLLAAELEKWYHTYVQIWDQTCKRSTLERTRRLINAMADQLRERV